MGNYVHSAAPKCCESAYRRAQTRHHHESRRLLSVITDVLYLDEVKAVFVLVGCSPASSVRERGGRERDCHLWSSSSASVFRQPVEEEGTLLLGGPPKLSPRRPDQSRGAPSWPLPGLPQQAPESFLGAGSVLSRMPWGHLPLMPPWWF